MNLQILESNTTKNFISVIVGLGFATILRPVCKTLECTNYKLHDINPKDIYKNGPKCMTFDTQVTNCDNKSITINEKLPHTSSNFKITLTDTKVIMSFCIIIFAIGIFTKTPWKISIPVFLILVTFNMYIGPNTNTIVVHPTPHNTQNTYKTYDTCFKYNTVPQECTKDAKPIPLPS
ncbi:hypothetical protein SAGO17_0098 [Mimivirus AB-566-O17]|uniref:Uncharacterized protein n=1 Tax=Mimivirus AB-566-O17 TaxID=1988039 RepID=A0A1X9VNX7_9VIRU|nr:hypothetical protein SAGO17_0098 [Mimivirus AB-566-O17]